MISHGTLRNPVTQIGTIRFHGHLSDRCRIKVLQEQLDRISWQKKCLAFLNKNKLPRLKFARISLYACSHFGNASLHRPVHVSMAMMWGVQIPRTTLMHSMMRERHL